MNWLELLAFLKDADMTDEQLKKPVRMHNGEYFFDIQLVGQLGADRTGVGSQHHRL